MAIAYRLFTILFLLSLSNIVSAASCPNKFFDDSCTCNPPQNGYCIAAGDKELTYYKIAEDLQRFVAPDSGFKMKVLEGESVKNLKRMRWQRGVKLTIVQSDVLEIYKDQQRNGNPVATEIIEPLRAILPLYDEEVHLMIKKSSGIKTFSDLKDKKIAVGRLASGPAITMKSIYNHLFGEPMKNKNIYYTPAGVDSTEDGLSALASDKVDVLIMVVGQGAERIADFLPEAAKHFTFVKFDIDNPQEKKILTASYQPATIFKDSYSWLDEDIPTLNTQAILITQRYKSATTKANIRSFTESLCKNFATLQEKGHDKWKQVKLAHNRLPGDWQYSQDVLDAFASENCKLIGTSSGQSNSSTKCAPEEANLNLCAAE